MKFCSTERREGGRRLADMADAATFWLRAGECGGDCLRCEGYGGGGRGGGAGKRNGSDHTTFKTGCSMP